MPALTALLFAAAVLGTKYSETGAEAGSMSSSPSGVEEAEGSAADDELVVEEAVLDIESVDAAADVALSVPDADAGIDEEDSSTAAAIFGLLILTAPLLVTGDSGLEG